MNEETRLILYSLKWVIERDTFNEELRKEMDKDICNKIVDLVNPIKKESIREKTEDAFSEKKIGCGKYFMYGAGEFICGGALHVNGKKKLCPNCEKFALSESKVPTHKEFQKAIDKSELRGYKFANQKQSEVKKDE